MDRPDILERDQLTALDFVIDLLGSASSCIGAHDSVAREMISEVVFVLEQISGRAATDVHSALEPASKTVH